MRWVAGYERAWRDGDLAAIAGLFTEDARYRPSPYEDARVGHAGIRAFWLDDDGKAFTVRAEPVAVEGRAAVVRLDVRYGPPAGQEYRDLWVLRFAEDGRVEDFEEWAYWPGQPYSAAADPR
jgi:ketosteroid isomerase-like protein